VLDLQKEEAKNIDNILINNIDINNLKNNFLKVKK
jgi:hypothetical protein